MLDTEQPASEPLAARTLWFDGRTATDWQASTVRDVPVETAVNIMYDEKPFAVMMTTPHDLEDFAYGFSLTERIIESASDIQSVSVRTRDRGIELRVCLSFGVAPRAAQRERNTAGRTGCGLCGIDQLDAMPMADVKAYNESAVQLSSIKRALEALESQQPLNRVTHAVHAAAWCLANGDIVAVREDVGRHNALDKLIGALVRSKHEPSHGFLVITSRCSFEMVEKAAAYGARTIVAISAPTSLAVERAAVHGMTMLAIARHDSALAFNSPENVIGIAP